MIFQTLHVLPVRCIQWLLHFLKCLLTVPGQHSIKIAQVPSAFPSTLHMRSRCLNSHLRVPSRSASQLVVCRTYHSKYDFRDCIRKTGTQTLSRLCPETIPSKRTALLRQVVTRQGHKTLYPFLVYPISSLGVVFTSSIHETWLH